MYNADSARASIIEDGEEFTNPQEAKSKIKKGLGELKIKKVNLFAYVFVSIINNFLD